MASCSGARELLTSGNALSADTAALTRNASSVTRYPSALAAVSSSLRYASVTVMSASSLCVTCGTLSQERCRCGPDTFLIRDRGCRSTGPNLLKSCAGIGGIAPPCAAGAGALGPRSEASRSSLVIRPFAPVPASVARSTPSSRAARRTPGPACTPAKSATPPAGGAAVTCGVGAAAVGDWGAGAGGVASGAGSCWSASEGGWVSAPSPGSSRRTGLPALTRSPTETRRPETVPADGAGTSMVALSDSSVIRGSSGLTWSPSLT
jgi:hypothetical protein